MRQQGSIPSPSPSRARRALALGIAGLVSVALTACGGGSGTGAASTNAVVKPPDFTLQGCTYMIDNKVPTGEPEGLKPDFPAFTPDGSATAALRDVKRHRGLAMVDSVTLPGGTDLYAGPDTGGTPVGVIPAGDSVLVAEPVVWTDARGGTWLAFYLACGGNSLYWVGVDRLEHENPADGSAVAAQIAQLKKAAPYTKTGVASLLPVVVNSQHQLAFADPGVTFLVGRGELTGLPG